MSELVPCILERKILPKVWGGRRLQSILGIELPEGEDVGETWEVYDRPDGSSRIRGSDLTLRDLMERHRTALLGAGVEPTSAGYFPLLLKFIDAHQELSIQVHPDDELSAGEDDGGKSEAWVVLESTEQGQIILGTRSGVTREQFVKVADTAAVADLLHTFRPNVGDTIYVPAGTVHSVGPGVVLLEIQQNSDVTYRLYDWGRNRETHVDKALAASERDPGTAGVQAPEEIEGGGSWLIRSPHFKLRRFVSGTPATLGTEGSFKVLTTLRGAGALGWRSHGQHEPLFLRAGDTALVPACTDVVFLSPAGGWEFLWAEAGDGE